MKDPRRKDMQYKISPADKQIDQAIRNVYEKYGPDLTAFFNAIKAEQVKRDERQAGTQRRDKVTPPKSR